MSQALPQSGGSYVRDDKGGLKPAAGTKPAAKLQPKTKG